MRLGGPARVCVCVTLALLMAGCEGGLKQSEPHDLAGDANLRPENHLSGRRTLKADHIPAAGSDFFADRPPTGDHLQETEVRGSGQFINEVQSGRTLRGEDGITLNLVNVPVHQAAKTILGDTLGLKYSVDERVAGSITLQTSSPTAKGALVDAFEAVLKANGAVIVVAGDFYSIVPAAGAAQMGIPLADKDRQRAAGVQAQIVPLQHVGPSEMKRLIEPIVHQGAILRADNARSLLVVSGTARELADVARLVETFDVDWMRGMSVGLYPVRSSAPEAVAKELITILGLDKDGPLKGTIRVFPNDRLGSVLVISSKPSHLDTARDWIEKLDKAAEQSERQLFVYQIQNRPAGELAELLRNVLSTDLNQQRGSDDGRIAPRFEPIETQSPGLAEAVSDARSLTESGTQLAAADASPVELSSRTLANTEPSTEPRSDLRQSFRTEDVKVVADPGNNALIIEALPKQYERIARILKRLDVQPIQVMLEAVIAEVSLNDDLRFGVKWYFEHKKSSFTFTDAINGVVASQFPGFSYFFAVKDVRVAIDALSEITDVKVVSAPSLMVMDNRRATLQIGDQVPVVTQFAQGVTNPDAPIVNSVALKDTGVILAVVPRVNESGRVVLDVEQEVSNVKRTTTSGIDSPTIQQRRIKTAVSVLDGEVVALGGLIQQRDTLSKSQVPLLGNLPVVGSAFRVKETEIDRTELVIFLRPLVVRNDDEARQVTDEFQSRINMDELMKTRGNRHYRRDADRILR